jgi:hypothetical protein
MRRFDLLFAHLAFVMYHAVRAAPAGKLEAMDFEKFIPVWWDDTEAKEVSEQSKDRLRAKIDSFMGGIGGA